MTTVTSPSDRSIFCRGMMHVVDSLNEWTSEPDMVNEVSTT